MDRQGTVVQHFVAGGIGGIANAILLLLLESVKIIPSSYSSSSSSSATSSSSSNASPLKYGHCWTTNTNYNRLLLPSLSYHLHVPTFRYATSLVLHNTLSHSILFGTYQLSKQCIEQQRHRMIGQLEYTRDGLTSANNGSSGGTNINNNNNNHHHDDINDHNDNIVQFATIAIAGGVAGQCQFVASYMSERWLGLVIDETARAAATTTTAAASSTMKAPLSSTLFHNLSSSSSSSSNISLRRHRFITSFYSTVPTVRSILLSFSPSAIGFLAYEYGKLMME